MSAIRRLNTIISPEKKPIGALPERENVPPIKPRLVPLLPVRISSPHRKNYLILISLFFLIPTYHIEISSPRIDYAAPRNTTVIFYTSHKYIKVAVIHEQERPTTIPFKACQVSFSNGTRHSCLVAPADSGGTKTPITSATKIQKPSATFFSKTNLSSSFACTARGS